MNGIDISHYQGHPIFRDVKAAGYDFVIMKAMMEHGHSQDTCFTYNVQAATAAGLKCGAYFYTIARDQQSAVNEAIDFARIVKPYTMGMGVWIDMEESKIQGIGKPVLMQNIKAQYDILTQQGFKVGVYCSYYWYKNVLNTAELQHYPLWIARYPLNDTGTVKDNLNPRELTRCKIWQFSSKGRVNGIDGNVDMDLTFEKRVLRNGMRGEDVRQMQSVIGTKADGIFGNHTEDALKVYQAAHNIDADGVCGPITWAVIERSK